MCAESNVQNILVLLERHYPEARTALNYDNDFQLLVAVILSARCTDEQVNKATPELFLNYGDPYQMARAAPEDVAKFIRGCGLYRNKSENLVKTAACLVEKHNGQVPPVREELMCLPGVGPKTANVVLSCAFSEPALAVDTHVRRVSVRLGLASGRTPGQVEKELMEIIPRSYWSSFHHRLISHGRKVCAARKPLCGDCFLHPYCHYVRNNGI